MLGKGGEIRRRGLLGCTPTAHGKKRDDRCDLSLQLHNSMNEKGGFQNGSRLVREYLPRVAVRSRI
jgi:hypothetical protein